MNELLDLINNRFYQGKISNEEMMSMKNFIVENIYKLFQKHCMDKELIIKNRINAISIKLQNAKVGEYYISTPILLNDEDVLDYWIEGLENTGLEIIADDSSSSECLDSLNNTSSHIVFNEPSNTLVTPLRDSLDMYNEGNSENDISQEIDHAEAEGCLTPNPEINTNKTCSSFPNLEGRTISQEECQSNQFDSKGGIGKSTHGLLIKGTPTVPGDFDLILKYRCKVISSAQIYERTIKFTINPDPRTLWKNIETDKNIKFYKEDTATTFICGNNEDKSQKDILAASTRGRSHAHEGKPRDDDFKLNYDSSTGWYIIAVADGAGSAKYSRKGSEIACETSVDFCKNALQDAIQFEQVIRDYSNTGDSDIRNTLSKYVYNIIGGAAYKAHRTILDASKNNGDTVKDYSTTLLLAICKKFPFGWFIASFWVGDGAICIYNRSRDYIKILGVPDGGEYAGQTRFLTMQEIFTPESITSRLRFNIETDFSALLMMTDGVSDPFFETDANLNKIEKWHNLWSEICSHVDFKTDNIKSQHQLLEWLNFWSIGNHDDRTIAILY